MTPDAHPDFPADILHRGLVETLGIVFAKLDADEVVATMPVTPRHHQPFGVLHGGASVVLAESIASVGGTLNCGPGKAAFGLEINANHVRSVRDGVVRGVGTPLHRGRTTQVWDVKLYDDRDRLVCVSRCTLAVVDRS
ncbi:MAG: hotdog fold thioesterase [Bacteroidota bacterium]